jgi:hypothetical protein
MPSRKLEIVQRLLPLVPDPFRETEDQAMRTWWVNLRTSGGLRLTDHGYHILQNVLALENWHIDYDRNRTITKQIVLQLNRKLEWPYYIAIKPRRLVFFSSREAMMATLYGDIQNWLANM